MSFWAHVGVDIKNLEVFASACATFGITFDKETMKLYNSRGYEFGRLEQTNSGRKLYMDTDLKWSELARQIGTNGEKLMQTYSYGIVQEEVALMGGMITNQETLEDGSLKLYVSIGGV